jgi:hypothetical protein
VASSLSKHRKEAANYLAQWYQSLDQPPRDLPQYKVSLDPEDFHRLAIPGAPLVSPGHSKQIPDSPYLQAQDEVFGGGQFVYVTREQFKKLISDYLAS